MKSNYLNTAAASRSVAAVFSINAAINSPVLIARRTCVRTRSFCWTLHPHVLHTPRYANLLKWTCCYKWQELYSAGPMFQCHQSALISYALIPKCLSMHHNDVQRVAFYDYHSRVPAQLVLHWFGYWPIG
jgi:hypothetical protein